MKKIGLVFSLVLFFSVSFQVNAQWINQNILVPDCHLYGVTFATNNVGWAVGCRYDLTTGVILKTTTGGNSWFSQCDTINAALFSINCLDSNNVRCVGAYGKIIRTTDGGNFWYEEVSPINSDFLRIFFIDNNNGWIVGRPNTLLKTINGGLNWDLIISQSQDEFRDLFFTDSNNGFIVGGASKILKTTNAGTNWNYSISPITANFVSISFSDLNNGIIVDEDGDIIKTTNGGNTWYYLNTLSLFPRKICYIDESNAFIAGLNGFIVRTSDGGNNWDTQISNTNYNLYDVTFISQNNGFIVGQIGTILHTTNGGVTFIEENNPAQPKEFLLQQNYPNPFNPSTKISWQSPMGSWQTLKVYDILGNEVATLLNEYRDAGSYEIDFQSAADGSVGSHQLANGVYFYQLKVEDYIETKKMILLK